MHVLLNNFVWIGFDSLMSLKPYIDNNRKTKLKPLKFHITPVTVAMFDDMFMMLVHPSVCKLELLLQQQKPEKKHLLKTYIKKNKD